MENEHRGRRRQGRRQVRGRVFIAASGVGDVQLPQYFAPSVESCPITVEFHRSGRDRNVTLNVTDRDGTVVFERALLSLLPDGRHEVVWDGRDTGGHYVTPAKSPYTATLTVSGFQVARQTNVAVRLIAIWLEEQPTLIMNDPNRRLAVIGTVFVRRTNGGQALTEIPIDVTWTCTPGRSNTVHTASYQASGGQRLGKQGNAGAVYWQSHPDCTFNGSGLTVQARTITSGAAKGKSKLYFKPSGVGGDTFTLKASIMASDGTTELYHRDAPVLTVWRRVSFDAYQMQGQSHISTHGTNAIIAAYYTGDTFVEYRLGTVNAIAAQYSVRYYGLWDRASRAQKNWTTWQRKTASETPTAAETTAANGTAGAPRTTARNAIQTKANAWRDRIITQYNAACRNWPADAGVPANTAIAAEFEHPKYSVNAPNADSVTSEWSAFPWLRIRVEGRDVHPDRRWVNGLGVEIGGRAYTLAGDSVSSTRVTIAHEAAHQSRSQFQRRRFGSGSDHSGSPGLMDPTGSRSRFTSREKDILRGKT